MGHRSAQPPSGRPALLRANGGWDRLPDLNRPEAHRGERPPTLREDAPLPWFPLSRGATRHSTHRPARCSRPVDTGARATRHGAADVYRQALAVAAGPGAGTSRRPIALPADADAPRRWTVRNAGAGPHRSTSPRDEWPENAAAAAD